MTGWMRSKPSGEVNLLMVMAVFLTFTTLVFGSMAIYYINQYAKVKSTVDQKVADAVSGAKADQQKADQTSFSEQLKLPYRSYTAPDVLGTLTVKFPKNWNLEAIEDQSNSTQLDLYWNPDLIRSGSTFTGPYALRLTLVKTIYTESVQSMQNNLASGVTAATPIAVKGVDGKNINGTRFSGKLTDQANGVMVMLPIRDKTLSIWTESSDFGNDFNTVIKRLVVAP